MEYLQFKLKFDKLSWTELSFHKQKFIFVALGSKLLNTENLSVAFRSVHTKRDSYHYTMLRGLFSMNPSSSMIDPNNAWCKIFKSLQPIVSCLVNPFARFVHSGD